MLSSKYFTQLQWPRNKISQARIQETHVNSDSINQLIASTK